MTLLLRTPAPYSTESLLGYALRVSESNGYDSPWHVFSLAEFEQGEILTAGFKVNKFAAVLGRLPQQLNKWAYREESGKKEFQLLGHPLGKSLKYNPLRLKKPALCPCCAVETGFIDAFWDLTAAIACPSHGTRAINHCPACNSRLTWFRPGLIKCKCGESLRSVTAQSASNEEIELMRILHAKLHYTSKPEFVNQSLPVDELWPLPLSSILDLLDAIGNFAIKISPNEKIADGTDVIRAAAITLSKWPANFHEFLRKLDKHTNSGGVSIRMRFNDFYQSMFEQRKNAVDFSFLRNEMIRFGSQKWGDGVVDSRMLDGHMEDQRYMSRNKLAKRINVDPRTVNKWASTGMINMKEILISSQRRFIADASGLSKTIRAEGKIIRQRQAAQQIKLPVSALSYLKKSRHYASNHTAPFKPGYHEIDLKNFHQALLEKSTQLVATPSEAVLTLEYILQEIRFWSKNGKGEFIAAYLDGHIASVGRLGNTTSSILFHKSDVERFSKELRTKASDGAISITEAAKKMNCNALAVKALAVNGYLEAILGPNRIRVRPKSIDNFMTNYISLIAIAKEHCRSTPSLHLICKKMKIETLCIPYGKSDKAIFIAIESVKVLVTNLPIAHPKNKRSAMNLDSTSRNGCSIKRIQADEALGCYLADLKKRGLLLPRRSGKPNLSAIAMTCGFDRNTLYSNSVVSQMLEKYQLEEAEVHGIKRKKKPSEALSDYLTRLKIRGEHLPLYNEKPNIREISKLCEFKRDWFYTDPALCQMLENHLSIEKCGT